MNRERLEQLRRLSPLEAVRAWLAGTFGMGEEAGLILAIRRDRRVRLSEREITKIIRQAMEEQVDPARCLEQLQGIAQSS